MAHERCVYESVLRDAKDLCEVIFVKWLTILMETSDQPNLSAERIPLTVVRLFRWIAGQSEAHIRHGNNLRVDVANLIKNRACEHGARYKGLVDYDDFWDEKRLRTLKDARRATRHSHLPVDGIAPLLDELKTDARKVVKEWKE